MKKSKVPLVRVVRDEKQLEKIILLLQLFRDTIQQTEKLVLRAEQNIMIDSKYSFLEIRTDHIVEFLNFDGFKRHHVLEDEENLRSITKSIVESRPKSVKGRLRRDVSFFSTYGRWSSHPRRDSPSPSLHTPRPWVRPKNDFRKPSYRPSLMRVISLGVTTDSPSQKRSPGSNHYESHDRMITKCLLTTSSLRTSTPLRIATPRASHSARQSNLAIGMVSRVRSLASIERSFIAACSATQVVSWSSSREWHNAHLWVSDSKLLLHGLLQGMQWATFSREVCFLHDSRLW